MWWMIFGRNGYSYPISFCRHHKLPSQSKLQVFDVGKKKGLNYIYIYIYIYIEKTETLIG
jgi:hypothetical protein